MCNCVIYFCNMNVSENIPTFKVYVCMCVGVGVGVCEHDQRISLGTGAGEDVFPSGVSEQTSLHINAARRKKNEAMEEQETARGTKVEQQQ